jgi:adenylate cyclase
LFAGLREYSLVLRAEGSPLFEKIRRSKDLFCILLPFIVLCFGLISFFLSGQITGTIRALERGLQRIEAGDLKNDIRVEGKEQFADLALQFNRLLGVLREKEKIAPFLSAMARNSITEQSPVSVREQVFVFFYGIRNLGDFPLSVQPELFEFFLSEAQNVVTLCGGQVDKFTGNAVLAVFKGEKGAVKALECADLLQNSRREKWPDQDFFLAAENNLPMIKTGIGIAFGPAVLGAVGAAARLDYTVIGNTVNVAARLETLPTDRDFAVFISGSVYEKLSSEDINNFTFKRLDDVSLKGKKELLTVYEVL